MDSSLTEILESNEQNKTKMLPTDTELLSQSKIIWKSGWKVKNGTICNHRLTGEVKKLTQESKNHSQNI